jgi:acyl-CoA thioesterase-1
MPSTAPSSAPAKDLSKGGTVLLLGDSILDIHKGDQRIEAAMTRLLSQRTPKATWTIRNHARGGEFIGPKEGTPAGVSQSLFDSGTTGRYFDIVKRVPHADVIVLNYGANDSKVYPPESFGKRMDSLCRQLEQQYPGATLILCTGMYLDPKHCAPYSINKPMVPDWKKGSSRNSYLEPYNDQTRKVAADHGYRVADTSRRIKQETEQGNWDLRVRGDGTGDPKDDPKHEGDMAWFDNIHPNVKCTELLTSVVVDALLESSRP